MSEVRTSVGVIGTLDVGDGPATPILFLHGVGSDKSVWRPQLDFFGPRRRAIAIDYPGYGESEMRVDAGRDDFAGAALALLDVLDVERAHVCGLSLGGIVAVAMHRLAAERCASLTIADSFAIHPDGQAIHDRSVGASRAMSMAELAAARAPMLLAPGATADVTSEVIATMSRIDPAAYRQGAQAVWLADEREAVAAIAVPTLVLVGTEDRITPPSLSRALASLAGTSAATRPFVELAEIGEAGHLANLEQPAAFNRALERFIAKTEAFPKG